MSEKTCNNCNTPEENCLQEFETEREPVPFWTYQETRARDTAVIKKLWKSMIVSWIVALLLPVAIHAGWLIYESMYDTISYEQDGGGINNVNLGEQGALYGAESQTENEEKSK